MVRNIRSFSIVQLLCATTITYLVVCAPVFAQDYGRIDTIRYWSADHHVNYLQAYHDTVIAKVIIKDSDDPDYFDISYNGGLTWQYAMDRHQQVDFIPGTGSYVIGFDTVYQQYPVPTQQYFWVFRQGRFVYEDTIGHGHPEYPLYIDNMLRHPTDPDILFYKAATLPAGGKINYMYVSTNDGRSWRLLDVPPPTQGTTLEMQIRFDYSDRASWYIGVNGRDVFGARDRFEWHRTVDSGRTFNRVETLHYFTGLWKANSTVSFPYWKQKSWHTKISSGTPVVWDISTGSSDTLQWMSNVLSSLFPKLDTGMAKVYGRGGYGSDETQTDIGFHPNLPGTFVMQVDVDSLKGSAVVTWKGIVATIDTGKTWSWVIRPQRVLIPSTRSIDPKHGSIYLSLNGNGESDDGSYMVLRVTPWSVPVVEHELNIDAPMSCWPNPARDVLHVHSHALSSSYEIVLVDLFGRHMAVSTTSLQQDAFDTTVDLDVRDVPSGRYLIRVTSHGKITSQQVIIMH